MLVLDRLMKQYGATRAVHEVHLSIQTGQFVGIIGRSSTGGIGLYLSEMIRVLEWREVAFLILLVLLVVAVIDAISRRLRAANMGVRGS